MLLAVNEKELVSPEGGLVADEYIFRDCGN